MKMTINIYFNNTLLFCSSTSLLLGHSIFNELKKSATHTPGIKIELLKANDIIEIYES